MEQVFKEKHFRLFSSFLEDNYGILYTREKTDILQTKLRKLMNKNNIVSFDEFYSHITLNSEKNYLVQFLDELTTHTTNFFRENNHFDFLRNNIVRILEKNLRIRVNGELRAWCAACSTGEEAYTLAMVLRESLPDNINIKILATDISKKVIADAVSGMYSPNIENEIEKYYINKYFIKSSNGFKVCESIKKLVTFRMFNLKEEFQFKNSFDIIFCRNVMIYFPTYVQSELLDKLYDTLTTGGLLFIGHSEGLSYRKHNFRYLIPSVYGKY